MIYLSVFGFFFFFGGGVSYHTVSCHETCGYPLSKVGVLFLESDVS